MPLLNDNQPTLVAFAHCDVFATVRFLQDLKKESVHCISLLHYLCWEANNTDYLYDRVDVSRFVKSLVEYNGPFDAEIRKKRFDSSFVNEYNGYRARIRALVLFGHARQNLKTFGK